jgi:phosphatidylglycerophosphatase GEP4
MAPFNLSATLNLFRTFTNPALALPHHTVSTFEHLPIPISTALRTRVGKEADIRAVILDKDNCFAAPHALDVYPAYNVTFADSPSLPEAFHSSDTDARAHFND